MQAAKHQLVIVCLASTLFFTNLGKPKLWDRDEPRNARCAAEMLERGDWTVPTFNGELRTHKPVLLYWLTITAYATFGISEFSARFWSAFLSVGTVLLTYSMGRRMFNARAAFWAAVILSSTLMFNVAAHAATPDATLIFCITLAMSIYVRSAFPEGRDCGEITTYWPSRWIQVILLYAAMGLAVLAKGPIGIVLPMAIIGMFLAIMRLPSDSANGDRKAVVSATRKILRPFSPPHLVRTAWSMRPLTALTAAAFVAFPWYVLVSVETDGEWVRSFLFEHNLGRASTAMEGHAGSTVLFYPLAILVGFFPWSIFAVPICIDVWQTLSRRCEWRVEYVFLLCWTGVFVGAFSLAQTKLPSYVTPTYPAIALLTGVCIERIIRGTSDVRLLWRKAAAGSFVAIGFALTVVIAFLLPPKVSGVQGLAFIGLIPMLFGALAWRNAHLAMSSRYVVSIATGSVFTMLAVFGYAIPLISEQQEFAKLIAPDILQSGTRKLASYSVHEPSWVFYAGKNIPFLPADQEDAAIELLTNSDTAVITTKSEYDRLADRWPVGTEVACSVNYFLKNDSLVLLRRAAHVAQRPTVRPTVSPSHIASTDK
ncbi:MAG: glycosyltransferase family 39 protein [Planctomycetales bacterium]|nr:glycosyltransferase family 39 protein [Planctomycetales bacterium]